MDSTIAIAKNISQLECEPEVKQLLQSLFNSELTAPAENSVTKQYYAAEIEKHFVVALRTVQEAGE